MITRYGSRATPTWYTVVYIGAAVVALVSVFPFFWMLTTSFKPEAETFSKIPILIPREPTLKNYIVVLSKTSLPKYFLNSVKVSLATTALAVALSCLASYGFSRFKFAGRKTLLVTILAMQMFPAVIIIIPLFLHMSRMRLLNTHWSLLVAYSSLTLPLAIWMLKGFFDGIPIELEQAAMIDGCTPFGAFVRILLPLSLPGIASAAIFVFISAWNEYVFALTFINQDAMRTMPIGLQSFFGRYTVEWNQLMAASVLFTVPSLIFFVLVQKYLTKGMVVGAVKG